MDYAKRMRRPVQFARMCAHEYMNINDEHEMDILFDIHA